MTNVTAIKRQLPYHPEPWVSTEKLAEHFGVSTKTIRRLKDQGMPCRRVGGQLRFRRSEADAWIDTHQEGEAGEGQ